MVNRIIPSCIDYKKKRSLLVIASFQKKNRLKKFGAWVGNLVKIVVPCLKGCQPCFPMKMLFFENFSLIAQVFRWFSLGDVDISIIHDR